MSKEQRSIRLTYIGGPTLLIESGGLRFLTDPAFDPAGLNYVQGPVTLSKTRGPAMAAAAAGKVDVVLLSHDHHFDNLDHSGRELLPKARFVVTTAEGAARLGGNATGLVPWQEWTATGTDGQVIRITATPAQHGPAGGDRGPVIGFVLEPEAGPTVYISGDTVWFDGVAETLRRFANIDVAVLFLGAAHVPVSPSHLTFTAEEAVRVAKTIPKAVIVPVHYEGWKHFTENRQKIAGTFAEAELDGRVEWLNAGEPRILTLA